MTTIVPIEAAKPAVPAAQPRVGVLLVNLGTPDAADARGVRRLSQGIPLRPARDREPGPDLEAGAQRHHPATPAARQGARLPEDLEQREERIAAEDHHALAGAKSSPPRCRTARTSWSTGRCATAIRRSRRGIDALIAQGLRPHPRRCRSIRNIRPRPRRPSATRCSACSPACASSRRCASTPPYYDDAGLYRGAGRLDRGASGDAAVRAGADPRLVPRHAEGLCRQGRSLSEPLRRDDRRLLRERLGLDETSCC